MQQKQRRVKGHLSAHKREEGPARTCTVHIARLPASVPYRPASVKARLSLKRVSASRAPML
jgi:hypothetical protein